MHCEIKTSIRLNEKKRDVISYGRVIAYGSIPQPANFFRV